MKEFTRLQYCITAILASFILNQANGASNGSNLTINTSPSGPVYPAATWIRVACRLEQPEPQKLQYRWTASCSRTGVVAYDIAEPFLDEESWAVIWLKSTPVECLDHFLCTVYEKSGDNLTEIDSMEFTPQVYGVGVSLPDNIFLGSIPNNSAVIVDRNFDLQQELLCHSALQSSCTTGEWLGLGPQSYESCNEGPGANTSYEFVRMDLRNVNESDKRVYTCAIQDEDLQKQQLFVGVYQSVPELEVESSFKVSEDTLLLECNTQGLPSTATLWSRDGILLSTTDQFTASSLLVDERLARYRNSLSLTDPSAFGIISCHTYSDWVTADKRDSGRKSATAFFLALPLSEQIQLECAFPEGVTHVQWLNDSVPLNLLPPVRNNTALMSLVVDEDTHGRSFRCTGVDSSGKAIFKQYSIIARVPSGDLTMRILPLHTEPALGQPLQLTCCANTSLALPSSLQWHRDGTVLVLGERVELQMSNEGAEKCLTALFLALTYEDAGEYVCRSALQSAGSEDILVKEMKLELNVEFLDAEENATDATTEEANTDEDSDTKSASMSISQRASNPVPSQSSSVKLVTIITSTVFALLLLLTLLVLVVILLAVCTRVRKQRRHTNSSTVHTDTHLDELDLKEEKI